MLTALNVVVPPVIDKLPVPWTIPAMALVAAIVRVWPESNWALPAAPTVNVLIVSLALTAYIAAALATTTSTSAAKVPVTSTVPRFTVKSPVNVLVPLNVNTEASVSLTIEPVPEIAPESVWVALDE